MIENCFNLVDEPWIPIAGKERASLRQIFEESSYSELGGNPIQKIALTKLLLAIAQTAYTPEDNYDWKDLGAKGMAKKCLDYLEDKHDLFYLYGEKPFLQMSSVVDLIETRTNKRKAKAKGNAALLKAEKSGEPKSFGAGFYPDLPSENNTVLSHTLLEKELDDAAKTVFIVSVMNFAFGGKRSEGDLVNLSGQVYGGLYSAKSSPSLGNYIGYLHSYLVGENLLTSLWFNLLTHEQINENRYWEAGLGVPPWESMPAFENCRIAENLKSSYMGCLVAMSRFVLLQENGLYYLDGIQYPSHKDGWREPSIGLKGSGKDLKVLWLNPDKRPWRELTSLLSFIDSEAQNGFDCQQINGGLRRAKKTNQKVGIWSGGLKVRANSGDQSVKQGDDFIESCVYLPSNQEQEESKWFENLSSEMKILDAMSSQVYKATLNYFKAQKVDGKNQASIASHLFWQLCEQQSQKLINDCDNQAQRETLRKTFARLANKAYNAQCPKTTARQLTAWVENSPRLGKYFKNLEQEQKEEHENTITNP